MLVNLQRELPSLRPPTDPPRALPGLTGVRRCARPNLPASEKLLARLAAKPSLLSSVCRRSSALGIRYSEGILPAIDRSGSKLVYEKVPPGTG